MNRLFLDRWHVRLYRRIRFYKYFRAMRYGVWQAWRAAGRA